MPISNAKLAGTALVTLAALTMTVSSDAKWHPKPKARAAAPKAAVNHSSVYRGNSVVKPGGEVYLSTGQGQLVNLSQPISDVFTSNEAVADINVRSTTQIYLFGKARGTASVYATNKAGQVIYSSNVFVESSLSSLDEMLRIAMPEDQITATKINGMIILTGTVLNVEDIAQASTLVNQYVGNGAGSSAPKVMVLNRIKTATPQQVNLQVRIAEVSRSWVKNMGINGLNLDRAHGTVASTPFTYSVSSDGTGTAAQVAGSLLGTNILGKLNLAETDGLVTTLAQPNLTALSGETASFLAGGEIPIPIATPSSTGGSTVTVEYKPYGVSLSFTPIVLADGRISMRVRPEISELTSDGSVTLGGLVIPALKVRRSETTVELGSGQSMVLAGLMQNDNNNSITKTPGLGDVPVLGTLFRSNAYKRGETELMIVVTPYLVKPVNANQIVLPTDGFKAPGDAARVLMGQLGGGTSGGDRPKPTMAPATTKAMPSIGVLDLSPAQASAPVAPPQAIDKPRKSNHSSSGDATPGFGS